MDPDRFAYYVKAEKDDIIFLGWSADYPHPQSMLDVFSNGAEQNYGEFYSDNAGALLDKAIKEQDGDASLELYRQTEQELINEGCCIPLAYGKSYMLGKPYVKGFIPNACGKVNFNRVTIDPH
jgi:oligopeptide transport system substrate-binding protein